MPITTVILAGMLSIIPKVPVLDFSKLPQPGGRDYQFTIRVQFEDRTAVTFPAFIMGSAADPDDAILLVRGALVDKRWNKRQDGLRLLVRDFGGTSIKSITIIGDGPKPAVRWVLAPPTTIPKK